MSRPLSVTLLTVVQGIISGLSLVSGFLLVLLLAGMVQVFSHDLTTLSLYLKGLVVLGLVISLLGLVSAYGLWTLKPWGWMGAFIFQLLCLANNGLGLLAGQPVSAGVYISAGIFTGAIFALLLPSVRQVFFPSSASTSD